MFIIIMWPEFLALVSPVTKNAKPTCMNSTRKPIAGNASPKQTGTLDLLAHRTKCFWQCMDTFKDKQSLEELNLGNAPWKVWGHSSPALISGRSNELDRAPAGV